MLKTFILSFIGVLLGIYTFASFQGTESNPYIKYSLLIQNGEINILDEKFKDALKSYGNAMLVIERPLASDCFTALQLAAFLDRKKEFNRFLETGFAVGLTPKDLKKDSLLNSFLRQNNMDQVVSQKFKKFGKIYSQNIDHFLLDTIRKMSRYDNKWKVHYLDSLSSVDQKNKQIYDDKYDSIVSNLVEHQLMPIIVEYGYPGQRKIGIHRVGRKSDPYNYAITNNATRFILLHYYSRPKSCEYNALLYSEMEKGHLIPEYYASIMDFQAKFGESKFCEVPYYNEWHSTEDTTQFENINVRRAKIGLEKLEYVKKRYDRGMAICREIDKGNYKHIKLFFWCG